MALRINTKPRHTNAGRPPEKRALGFLQWLRGRNCALADKGGCHGPIVAAHVDYAGGKGMATKVADRFAVPMCDEHHREQHTLGWQPFEKLHDFDGLATAEAFWRAWPGRVKWERKLEGTHNDRR